MLRIGALSLLFFQCFWLINSKKAPITKIRTGIVLHLQVQIGALVEPCSIIVKVNESADFCD